MPHAKAPVQKWVHSTQQTFKAGKNNMVKENTSIASASFAYDSKKYAYSNNYKGNNPMTRTQWRRFQRSKKAFAEASMEVKTKNAELKESHFSRSYQRIA